MPFVKIDQSNSDPRFSNRLISCVGDLDRFFAALNEINGEMQQMTTAQIEQFYGVAGFGSAVKDYINSGLGVLIENEALIKLRTQIG